MSKQNKLCCTCLWVESIFMGFNDHGLPWAKYTCNHQGKHKRVNAFWNCGHYQPKPRVHSHLD